MKNKFKLVALFLVLLYGCAKKPYPDSVSSNDPQYLVTAEIGNEQVKLAAGVDGYYLYSDLKVDAVNVNVVSGEYRATACNNCVALKVEVRDYKATSSDAMNTDSLFKHGVRAYITDATTKVYPVSFQSTYNKAAKNYLWDFGDGSTSNEINPTHNYRLPGKYNVKVKAISQGGCESTALNEVTVGETTAFTNAIIKDSLGATYYRAETTLEGALTYFWEFGNGDTLTTKNKVITYKHKINGSYLVALTVKSTSGVSKRVMANVVTSGDASSCAVNMRVRAQTPTDRLDLSRVNVIWKDAAGREWTSVGEQTNSVFEILSSEPAGTNENGKPIYKVRVQFNCQLYNNGNVLNVKNANATIAFPVQ